jgi:hypothetical protein
LSLVFERLREVPRVMMISPELNAVMIEWFGLSIFMMKACIVIYAIYMGFVIIQLIRD